MAERYPNEKKMGIVSSALDYVRPGLSLWCWMNEGRFDSWYTLDHEDFSKKKGDPGFVQGEMVELQHIPSWLGIPEEELRRLVGRYEKDNEAAFTCKVFFKSRRLIRFQRVI